MRGARGQPTGRLSLERPRRSAGAWASPVNLATVLLAALSGCSGEPPDPGEAHRPDGAPSGHTVVVDPRTPHLVSFSCMEQCHYDLEPNPMVRPLTEYHTIRPIEHGPGLTWCTSCHYLDDYDQLRISESETVSFDESYRLCAQCHGDKIQDWIAGIHGLQTGSWSDVMNRRSCTYCHDPHVPGLPTMEALPAPLPPPGSERSIDGH